MSSLNDIEKLYLEKILRMGDGYVLNYSDATYGEFFDRHRISIHGPKYRKYGTSNAKKMRAFWEIEPGRIVGMVLDGMLNFYKASCDLNGNAIDAPILSRFRGIVNRLLGKRSLDAQEKRKSVS